MAKVIVIGTGGTIASTGDPRRGAVATHSGNELVAGLAGPHDIEVRDLMTVGSYQLSLAQMRRIAEAASAAAAEPGVAGVVVTHGTDTMEETAYLTSLYYAGRSPIVFTGAQFAADNIAPDGPRNLRDAIEFAAAVELRGTGVAGSPGRGAGVGIAFGGDLLAARGTRKMHSTDPNPFAGGVLLARCSAGGIAVHATARSEPAPLAADPAFDRLRVEMVMSYPGADPALFEHAAAHADAVVLVGTGVGNAAPGFAEAVARATDRGTPVVLASRVAAGPISPIYGNGGGADLLRAGAISAGELSAPQARVLAATLLSQPDFTSVHDLRNRFGRHAS